MLTRTIARALVAGTAISLSVMAGCERSDPASVAIKAAADKLAVASTGPNTSPVSEKKEAALKEVLALVQPHASAAAPATASAANVIIARVQAGLGEIRSSGATEIERRASNRLVAMRAYADVWTVQSSRAAADGAYDPAAELASLDKTAKDIEAKIGEASAAKQRAEAKVAEIEKNADGVAAQASGKREQAQGLKRQMTGGTATQGLDFLEKAAAIAREADALDLRVSDLRGQAQSARPAVDAANREIELLKSRKASVAKLKETVTAKGQALKESAAEARKTADAAAAELAASVKAATDERSGEISAASEAAIKAFRDSQASAKKAQQGATSEGKASAALLAAGAQQSIADVQLGQARGDEALAVVLKGLATSNPALPSKAALEGLAKDFQDRAAKGREEARESYKAAADAYQGVSGKDLTERMERIQNILKNLTGEAQKAPEAAETPAAKPDGAAPAGGDSAKPAAAADPAATADIKKMLGDMAAAVREGDIDKATGFFAAENDAQEEMVNQLLVPMLKMGFLSEALKAKFGANLPEILAASPMGAMMGPALKGMDKAMDFSTEGVDVKVNGDKATITSPGSDKPQELVKKGPQWLFTVPADGPKPPPMMVMMFAGLGDASAALAPDVKAGKFKTKEEFLAAFMAKMPKPQGMPGMPKPPGGG